MERAPRPPFLSKVVPQVASTPSVPRHEGWPSAPDLDVSPRPLRNDGFALREEARLPRGSKLQSESSNAYVYNMDPNILMDCVGFRPKSMFPDARKEADGDRSRGRSLDRDRDRDLDLNRAAVRDTAGRLSTLESQVRDGMRRMSRHVSKLDSEIGLLQQSANEEKLETSRWFAALTTELQRIQSCLSEDGNRGPCSKEACRDSQTEFDLEAETGSHSEEKLFAQPPHANSERLATVEGTATHRFEVKDEMADPTADLQVSCCDNKGAATAHDGVEAQARFFDGDRKALAHRSVDSTHLKSEHKIAGYPVIDGRHFDVDGKHPSGHPLIQARRSQRDSTPKPLIEARHVDDNENVAATSLDDLVERVQDLTQQVEAMGMRTSTTRLDEMAQRIDATITDLTLAKYLIACDCLSLARGEVKDKMELETINWVMSNKADGTASMATQSHRGEVSNAVSSAAPDSIYIRSTFGRSLWGTKTLRATGSRWDIGTDMASNYHLRETVWDAALLLGFSGIGFVANCMLFIGLLANITVQLLFCLIAAYLPSERNYFTEDATSAMSDWHSLTSLDTRIRVCSLDETLSTDYHQWSTLADATDYSRPFVFPNVQQGPVLCCIVLIAWTLCSVAAMRSCVDFVVAVHNACDPTSQVMCIEYRLQRFTLSRVPVMRVVWADVLGILQACIAVVLLYFGAMWLIATTKTSDLVLNAVALTYIMEIDELVFLTVVPRQVSIVISNLHPLDLRRRTSRIPLGVPIRALCSLVAIFLFVFGMTFALSQHVANVDSVVTAMCG